MTRYEVESPEPEILFATLWPSTLDPRLSTKSRPLHDLRKRGPSKERLSTPDGNRAEFYLFGEILPVWGNLFDKA